jgi:hypothetical protein
MPGRIAWRAFGSGCSTISVGSCRPSRGESDKEAGGIAREGARAASMASRMSGRGCIRIDDSGRPLCSGRVSGSIRENNSSVPRTRRASSFVSHVP